MAKLRTSEERVAINHRKQHIHSDTGGGYERGTRELTRDEKPAHVRQPEARPHNNKKMGLRNRFPRGSITPANYYGPGVRELVRLCVPQRVTQDRACVYEREKNNLGKLETPGEN
ncbi:hypothetical protein Pcinc_043670 [Petrolisthes cinctipes]|uniref:Uncharacterized protein n=1 Tax=Petrolisthes cinctipes TaxID=88211 RepID=A0AAE1EFX2_PETCI|nr:hypothetical protein Pcinc_043670 [Petrolisthes cinctipes]